MKKRKQRGPKRSLSAVVLDVLITTFLLLMILFGVAVVGGIFWALGHGYTGDDKQIAFLGFASSAFLTGITTIYCGLTGFILLENRKMRLQAIMPHIRVISSVRAEQKVTIEVENVGAAQAVDIAVAGWVMLKAGGTSRTPEPKMFRGDRPALAPTATLSSSQIHLTVDEQPAAGHFDQWKEHFDRTDVAPEALDPKILLIHITYGAVDGTTMSECIALPIREQPSLPGDPHATSLVSSTLSQKPGVPS